MLDYENKQKESPVNTENTECIHEDTENPLVTTENLEQTNEAVLNDVVTTENNPPTESSMESSDNAKQNNTENHILTENNGDKTYWKKLMINSDDSLFEEMTKQMVKTEKKSLQ